MIVLLKSETNLADAINQKVCRRQKILFKKVSKYSSEYDANIYIVLCMKKTRKIFILTSNIKDWSLSQN